MKSSAKAVSKLKKILSYSLYLLGILIATMLITSFVCTKTVVEGTSMSPTLSDGDRLLVDKLSYRFNTPKRYDVIVFPLVYSRNEYVVKRIIGMPGETVRIDNSGKIYINDKEIADKYFDGQFDAGIAEKGLVLGREEYFVLGDNRTESIDSRSESIGLIRKSTIVGRVWLRMYPDLTLFN